VDGPGDAASQYQVFNRRRHYHRKRQVHRRRTGIRSKSVTTKDREIGSQSIEQLAAQNVLPPSYFSPSYTGKVQDDEVLTFWRVPLRQGTSRV
jgi:hypothetical protein